MSAGTQCKILVAVVGVTTFGWCAIGFVPVSVPLVAVLVTLFLTGPFWSSNHSADPVWMYDWYLREYRGTLQDIAEVCMSPVVKLVILLLAVWVVFLVRFTGLALGVRETLMLATAILFLACFWYAADEGVVADWLKFPIVWAMWPLVLTALYPLIMAHAQVPPVIAVVLLVVLSVVFTFVILIGFTGLAQVTGEERWRRTERERS